MKQILIEIPEEDYKRIQGYDKLGNAVNHELTLKFIHSGFDLSLVRPKESGEI